MIRIDGHFLYQVGAAIHPLTGLNTNWTKFQALGVLWGAQSWLDTLLNRSVYRLQTSWPAGTELLATVTRIKEDYAHLDLTVAEKETLPFADQFLLTSQARKFETVLSAELQLGQLYLVQPKGGFDLIQLAEVGITIFPKGLIERVPEAMQDAREAARCIAFALPTAAAFHLHRLNELVLRRYYDHVTKGQPRPEHRNIGAYIDALKNHQFKDKKMFSALATLKDFHRNPVLHPDDRLEDVDEAIALLGSINTVITYMLKALPPEPLKLTSPPSQNDTEQSEDKTAKS